ncbi:MAG: HAD-IIA family hydrolase [Anaerolineales bacterium]
MNHFSEAKGLIFDMDGVLWRGGKPLPGIQSTFSLLRARLIPFVLATNNASQTFEQVRSRMEAAGVSIEQNEVLTSAVGAASHLKQHVPTGSPVYAVGDPVLREALDQAGYQVQESSEGVAAVVVGMDWSLTWEKLAEACYALMDGAFFLGTNPDVTFPTERGLAPGNGSILAALETATGLKATMFGKPEPHLFTEALKRIGTPATHTVAIGDRLETDILGGKRAGMPTALVLTGVATAEQVADSDLTPDWVFEDLEELSQALSIPGS